MAQNDNKASSGDHDPLDDRGTDVYLGHLGSPAHQQKTRDRINWMLGQRRGSTALDIGCSQGILSLLLARAGISVTSVDINERAISTAENLIADEPQEIRERARFLIADATVSGFIEGSFETVFIGEVVEHLERPAKLVHAATECLAPGGALVLTTPHGHLPHDDHRQAFGLQDVIDLLPRHLSVIGIDIKDGYVRLHAEYPAEKGAPVLRPDPAALLDLASRGLIQQQHFLYDLLASKRKGYNKLLARHTALEKQSKENLSKLKAAAEKLKADEEKLGVFAKKLKVSEESLKAAKERLKTVVAENKRIGFYSKRKQARLLVQRHEIETLRRSATFQAGLAVRLAFDSPWPNLPMLPYRLGRLVSGRGLSLSDPFTPPESIKANVKIPDTTNAEPLAKAANSGTMGAKDSSDFPPFVPFKTAVPGDLPVAVILDEFSTACFADEWRLTPLSPGKWKEELDRERHAFLLVESAWRGNDGQWRGALTRFAEQPNGQFAKLLRYCREINLPTVFWNKEDPPNFNIFREVAAVFDHVFTTDADCIPRYHNLLGHDRVYALPFAAQPRIHNPAGRDTSPERQVAFAGAWYGTKHIERRNRLPMLLDAAIATGNLTIFDRCSELPPDQRKKHTFPDRFSDYLRPALKYDAILSAYRSFPVFLNVNSVSESPTMFARRVFELLACGTNVVSSPSRGMTNMLGDLVSSVDSQKDTEDAIKGLAADPAAAARKAHLGYRKVMREHTYKQRANEIRRIVLPESVTVTEEPTVSVILTTNRPERLTGAIDSFRRQSHERKELLLVLNSAAFDRKAVEAAVDGLDDVRVLNIPEDKNLTACLNQAISCTEGKYWAKFDDDDQYGDEYLADALLPFRYTDAGIVGKGTYFVRIEGDETLYLRHVRGIHRHTGLVCGGTLVVDAELTREVRFDESLPRGGDTDFLRKAARAGAGTYAADPYNFIQNRKVDSKNHTWAIDQKKYLKYATVESPVYNEKLVMI